MVKGRLLWLFLRVGGSIWRLLCVIGRLRSKSRREQIDVQAWIQAVVPREIPPGETVSLLHAAREGFSADVSSLT